MHASTLKSVVEHLRKWTDPTRVRELSDADLLERFRRHREEAAFTLLLQRHGPMVLAVCRRILGDAHEAEDAFQASFLVLIRSADKIRKKQSLGSWLHGVAARVAHKARMRSARQRTQEREALSRTICDDPSKTLVAKELRAALDQEIARLPDKYRTPLVLCYLADKTHEQAAGELGWPKSSVTARLMRARELLQRRLRKRGFTVPAGLLAALLTEQSANAALPALLTLSTVRLAAQALVGETLTATSAAALAGGFVRSTATRKLGAMLALLATLGVAAIGYRMIGPESPSPAEQPASKAQALREPRTAKSEPRQPRADLFGDPLPEEAVARLGSSRLRHPGSSGRRSFLFSPDGKQIISSTRESLWISDAATGKLLRRFDFDFDQVSIQTSCLYVGDSIIWAGMSAERIVAVQTIDAATGQLRRRLRIKEATGAFNQALSPDGKRLAWPRRDEIRLYDTTSGEMVQRIPHKGIPGWSFAFAPDGKSIALNDLSDTIYLYDTATGKLIRDLKHPGDSRLQVVFSPDGRFLASIPQRPPAEKGEVSIWSVKDGKEVHRWTHPFSLGMSAAFSPDGKRVAIGDSRWGLVLWDVETGKEVRRLSPLGGAAYIAFSPDGKVLATSSPTGAIRLWDAATGNLLSAPEPDVDSFPYLHFSSDSKRVFSGGGVCLVWDAATGRELKRFTDPQPLDIKHFNDLRLLALSPDESLLAIARPREKISLRDAATGKEKQTLQGDDPTYRLLFAPDGRRLISTGNKGMVRVWDVASGRELHHMPGSFALAISPDGRHLATAPAGMMTVFVYDLTTGQETKRFAFPQDGMAAGSALLGGLAFAPDGSSLAAVGFLRTLGPPQDGIIKLWDLTGSERVYSFDSQKKPITNVAFSPDGRSLATGGLAGELILWEVSSGRRRHAFAGQEGQISPSLAFSPDGRTLAASSAGGPVYVWDVAGSLQSKPHRLLNDELQRDWNALGGEDASAAFQAIRRLAAAPEQTLPFLREHLKPVPAPDQKRIRQLVEMLDNADFSTRQKAVEELEKQNDAAAGLLRQIVAKEKPSLEVRRRLQQIVESIESKSESLRAIRAMEVLEWMAMPEAVRFINELASGAAGARLTNEAAAAKRRLQR